MAYLRIPVANPVITVTGAEELPTGEVGDLKITVNQIRDYILAKTTIPVAAGALRGCGSSPVSLVSAPGANKFTSPTKVLISYKAGGTGFNFTSELVIKTASGEVLFMLSGSINTTSSKNFQLAPMGQEIATNEALILTTTDGSDASLGTGDIDVILYYSTEDVNT